MACTKLFSVAGLARSSSSYKNYLCKTARCSYYRSPLCITSSTSSFTFTERRISCATSGVFMRQHNLLAICPKDNTGLSLGSPVPVRGYMRKKTVKIPPTKTLDFCSDDIEKSLPSLDLEKPKVGFENVAELETANETVKKLFSLRYSGGRDVRNKQIADLIEKIRVKGGMTQALEMNIALYTVFIRNQMRHCQKFRRDKVSKVWCFGRIRARKRMIMELRELDYENFEWLLKELKIRYVPPNEYSKFKESKRAKRKRLAREQAIDLRKAKLEEYSQKLKKEKISFLEFKKNELSDIISQMKELGISEKESLDDMLKELDPVKYPSKNPPTHPRRWYRLEHKFKIHEEKMRQEKAKLPPVNQIS